MEKAQTLLESTSLKTGEIALLVGYQDKNYFLLLLKSSVGFRLRHIGKLSEINYDVM